MVEGVNEVLRREDVASVQWRWRLAATALDITACPIHVRE